MYSCMYTVAKQKSLGLLMANVELADSESVLQAWMVVYITCIYMDKWAIQASLYT